MGTEIERVDLSVLDPLMPLFREFWRSASAVPNVYATPFNAQDPVNTPRGLNTADSTTRNAILQAFGKAIATFNAAGVAMDAPLGSVQYLSAKGQQLPVPGGDEFEGVLNKQEFASFTSGSYSPFYGSSYVQMISLGGNGSAARGILTFSQSTDPASQWFHNQLPAYGQHKLFTLPAP